MQGNRTPPVARMTKAGSTTLSFLFLRIATHTAASTAPRMKVYGAPPFEARVGVAIVARSK